MTFISSAVVSAGEEAEIPASGTVRRCQSCLADAREAVREFRAGLWQPDIELVLFFCSSSYDLDAIADEMARQFAGIQVIGCTTAGEIGPAGYRDHSISGASFPAGSFTAVGGQIEHLQQFESPRGRVFAQASVQKLESRAPHASPENSFALLLIDGLSVREEQVTRALQSALRDIPLVGGSAGDGVNFARTHVYYDGHFHSDAAVMVLITTPLPFRTFKIQHFVPMEERLVVTAADAARRVVQELNGVPADEEYARVVGVAPSDLQPTSFASSPFVVVIDGTNYVRSVQKANPDGSLTFYCAIEEGLVLRVARGVDLVANLLESFDCIRGEIGAPELTISCDCILRKIEMLQGGMTDRVSAAFTTHNAIGLSTYGEQYRGIHVNQTLTGIAIGRQSACDG
jgi:hypothetical protein